MKKILVLILASLMLITLVTGCSSDKEEPATTTPAPETETEAPKTPVIDVATAANAQDGTYKVEEEAADAHGWKGFVELVIKDKKIEDVNFDYTNAEGKLKTEDADYKASMEASGTYPEKYSAELEAALIEKQDVTSVDTVTGATDSSILFKELSSKALGESEAK